MRKIIDKMTARLTSASLLLVLTAASAAATEGYFQNGYGARQKALAGAGVADGRDATSASLNPAGLVFSGNEFSMSVSAFAPSRDFTGSGQPGFTPTGTVESDSNLFFVPNIAYSRRLTANPFADVFAITVYGNGGMNTDYRAVSRPLLECGGGSGVFCGGQAGVDLQQALISFAIAKQITPGLSIGVAPILARQQFRATGLAAFTAPGFSTSPNNLTNNGVDVSWGGGVRAGIQWAVVPGVRFGLAGSSRIYMQPFDKYSGLFAEKGDFDIPASMQIGMAVDVTPNLTLMADYRHIWYSSVAAIGNASNAAAQLGSNNGPGFGWKDVDTIKVAAEWRASSNLTLRVGYSHNTQPIQSRDVMLNILAPATVQNHFTAGAMIKLAPRWDLELAGMYAPYQAVSGFENAPGNPRHAVTIGMKQIDITVGVKYRFGGDNVALAVK